MLPRSRWFTKAAVAGVAASIVTVVGLGSVRMVHPSSGCSSISQTVPSASSGRVSYPMPPVLPSAVKMSVVSVRVSSKTVLPSRPVQTIENSKSAMRSMGRSDVVTACFITMKRPVALMMRASLSPASMVTDAVS